jgi:sugar/nucleoside kinase (ribokinase family)
MKTDKANSSNESDLSPALKAKPNAIGGQPQAGRQILVIGSTVVDVLLRMPRLPGRGEDVNVSSSEYRFGGCAYNVYKILRTFKTPARLCSPVGKGIYGRMVREHFAACGIEPFIELEEENGCCYCFIEDDGERSFLSHHGAEYLFKRSWIDKLDFSGIGSVFICGIEVEEPTGNELVDFVYEHPALDLYFAPGPRIMHIAPDRMKRLLERKPFLHLNETEACGYSGAGTVPESAAFFSGRTGNYHVITMGGKGCYYLDMSSPEPAAEPVGRGSPPDGQNPDAGFVPAHPVNVVRDTVGAGDAHCGAVIACLSQGKSLKEACETANGIGAALVSGEA